MTHDMRAALVERRDARQDIFDHPSKISADNDARWKRLSDAEHSLMDQAREVGEAA